jgi:ankyrin repeat protein
MNAVQRRLVSAIESGDCGQVGSFVGKGHIDINMRLPGIPLTSTALHLAASCGHEAVVAMLLDAGAHIDAICHDGLRDTACHAAIRNERTGVATLLISRGANLTIRDISGFLPLCNAVYNHNERVTRALIEAGAPLTPQHTLCHAAAISTAVISLLLERRIDVAALRDDDNGTPCHAAAGREFEVRNENKSDVVDMLLGVVGVDVNARGYQGASCSHTAVLYQNREALIQFIQHGADVDQTDDDGLPPLDLACSIGEIPCALVLLAAGADVSLLSRRSAGSSSISCLLRAARADTDVTNCRAKIALRKVAAEKGRSAPTADEIEFARRRIARARIELVRNRAFQVCVGLHSLRLDALQMCEILLHSCGPVAPLVPFHCWWKIATKSKHFFDVIKPMRSCS